MNNAVIRISTEKMIEIASEKSSSNGGSGRMSTTRMVSTPTASARSPRLKKAPTSPRPGSLMPPIVLVVVAAVISLMLNVSARDQLQLSGNTQDQYERDQTGSGHRCRCRSRE